MRQLYNSKFYWTETCKRRIKARLARQEIKIDWPEGNIYNSPPILQEALDLKLHLRTLVRLVVRADHLQPLLDGIPALHIPECILTQLVIAARRGYYNVVKTLIEDKRVKKRDYGLLIEAASYNGREKIVKLLLPKDNFRHVEYCSKWACALGSKDLLRWLFIHGQVRISYMSYLLVLTCNDSKRSTSISQLEIATFLLSDLRVDLSMNGYECIRSAHKSGNAALLALLLSDSRVPTDIRDVYNIHQA
ncbi:Hypothetical protein POVR2_LOCUS188 [uncultured virus]|nr:Hypothetical protein POVR2_LOCUS188 [uncultured virus]